MYVSKLYKRVTCVSSSHTSISAAPELHSGGLQQPFGGQISLTAYSRCPYSRLLCTLCCLSSLILSPSCLWDTLLSCPTFSWGCSFSAIPPVSCTYLHPPLAPRTLFPGWRASHPGPGVSGLVPCFLASLCQCHCSQPTSWELGFMVS